MATFAGLATVLAGVGIFGVTARGVSSRAREMAIRTALGAESPGLVRLALRDTMISAAVGVVAGLVGTSWVSGVVAHFLFGVGSRDPLTYVAVVGMLLSVCLVAAYLPARRVTRIAPMEAIGED